MLNLDKSNFDGTLIRQTFDKFDNCRQMVLLPKFSPLSYNLRNARRLNNNNQTENR